MPRNHLSYFCRRNSKNIYRIAVKLTDKQDLRGFVSLDGEIPARFTSIEGEVQLGAHATAKQLRNIQILVDKYCPVHNDLTRQTPVNLQVKKV